MQDKMNFVSVVEETKNYLEFIKQIGFSGFDSSEKSIRIIDDWSEKNGLSVKNGSMKKNWKIADTDHDTVNNIATDIGCEYNIAAILANRNLTEKKEIEAFLNPTLKNIRNPSKIKNIQKGTERIAASLINKEKILIFGDYDVDGVTSAAIVYKFLKQAGGEVVYYIPHRTEEGYGLKEANIDYAIANNISLIITTDCGIRSIDAVQKANESAIDVIITDHHEIEGNLPEAYAIINPKLKDSEEDFEFLAGVGVAFYLLINLRTHLREIGFWKETKEPDLKEYCDLVALGTLADVVPLIKENRIFASFGVKLINGENKRPGIKALIDTCKFKRENLDFEDISYYIIPKLNAAGRMDHASDALKLLVSDDYEKSESIAKTLNDLNLKRQEIEKEALNKIYAYIHQNPSILKKNALIFSDENFHEGIIGIMASRIAQRYNKPAILITLSGGMGKGSARSVSGFDLYKALGLCSEYFEDFGGHSMAAGIKIKIENIKKFKALFEKIADDFFNKDNIKKDILIDLKLKFSDINENFLKKLKMLAPFGTANPEPLFIAENVTILKSWTIADKHRNLILSSGGCKNTFQSIWFNGASKELNDSFNYLIFKIKEDKLLNDNLFKIVIKDFC